MTVEKPERTEAYDVSKVKFYLSSLDKGSNPSEGSMNGFNAPEEWKEYWQDFLKESWTHKLRILKLAMPNGNVILDNLPVVPLRKLFIEQSKQAIQLEQCQIVSITEVKPYDEWIFFRCQHCGATGNPESKKDWVYARDEPWVKPGKHGCDFPQVMEVTNPIKDAVDSQWIKIQELQNDSSDVPQSLDCLLKGKEMMWIVGFHERVSLIGILRYTRIRERDGSSSYRKWFEVFGVKIEDPEAHIPLTEKDIAYIDAEMKKPGFYQKLVRSFAPHIWGMEPFKEAILLVLASMKLPKPARLLMVTDPSLGKSELIQYTCSLVANAQHTQMGKSSSAGLTVASEKDEDSGRRYISRGAAPAAHNGLLAIDEIQMGQEKEFQVLNDMLESGKVRYSMASQTGYLNANCAVILAANPHKGRFGGDEESLQEILKFLGNNYSQFVSRMTLILMKRDNNSDEEERKIATHMYRHNKNDPLYMSRYQDNWYDWSERLRQPSVLEEDLIFDSLEPIERFGTKWIKKIIKYVTNHVTVGGMARQYEQELVDYYMRNRQHPVTSTNKLITKRFLGYEMVVAQYMARLQGLSQPTKTDINRAIELLEKTMSTAAFDPKTGEIDVNPFNNSRSANDIEKMSKTQQFEEAIEKAMLDDNGKNKGYFTMDEITYCCQMMPGTKWKNYREVEAEVNKRLNNSPVKLMEKYGLGYMPID
jgi:DNA replicative helicase MCM subunit Mcm2 (Cdc46/Mcm family)